MNFKCVICNYITNNKTNYEKHLKSIKCVSKNNKNNVNFSQNQITIVDKEINLCDDKKSNKNGINLCKYCKKKYSSKSALSRHQNHYCKLRKSSIKKYNEDIDITKVLEDNNKIMKKVLEENKYLHTKMEEMYKNNNNTLIYNNNQLTKANEKVTEITNKTMDNFKFILKYFSQAPNLKLPNNLEETLMENMDKLLKSPNPCQAITDLLVESITTQPQDRRSIHGIDRSRCKFITKKDDEWSQDHNAMLLIRDFMRILNKACLQKSNKSVTKLSSERAVQRIAFIEKIEKKEFQKKVAKNLFDKVKLNQISFLRSLQSTM